MRYESSKKQMAIDPRYQKSHPKVAFKFVTEPMYRHVHAWQPRKNLGTGDLAGLKAGGADVHLTTLAVDDNVDTLNVGTELADGDAVRVADRATSNGVLTADFANFGHV